MTSITRRFLLSTATAMVALPSFAQEANTMEIEDIIVGDPNAPVEVIEYASFTCPHCRSFHEGPYKQMKADYIDTGKVKFVYREVIFDPFGLWAAIVARCAGPDRYMAVADMIYTEQSEWQVRNDPGATAANLTTIGKRAGMDEATINECLSDRDFAVALVDNYRANAEKDGVNSTPTLFINGRKHGNMRYDELAELIEAEL